MVKELTNVMKGLTFLLAASLVLAAGFLVFVLTGRYVMGLIAQPGGPGGGSGPLLSVVFVTLVVLAEGVVLWCTGKYLLPLLTRSIFAVTVEATRGRHGFPHP